MNFPARSRFSPRRRNSFHQKLYSRLSAGRRGQTGIDMRRSRRAPTTTPIPLDFIRNMEQPPLLLIVPEHACRCGYSLCRGFIVSKYASEGQVDIYGAMRPAYLCYFLRSDAKTGFRRCWLSAALPLMILSMAACTRGALAIP